MPEQVKTTQPTPVAKPVEKGALVFVTIPEADNFDFAHPDIIVNGMVYKAGETYHLEPVLAATIEDRIKKFRRSQVRLNNPSPDVKSLDEAKRYGSSKQGNFVAPHAPEFS